MKTIAELKKSAMVLSRNELKSLFGGRICDYGESLITCTITDQNGSYSGVLCASSGRDAAEQIRERGIYYDTLRCG